MSHTTVPSAVPSEDWQEFLAVLRERTFEATITQRVPFGALAIVGPGVPGLLPAAAMKVEPEVGAVITVRVVEVDEQRRRVSLAAT